jgi:hypothetical protein
MASFKKDATCARIWNLEFELYLEFVFWNLEFHLIPLLLFISS